MSGDVTLLLPLYLQGVYRGNLPSYFTFLMLKITDLIPVTDCQVMLFDKFNQRTLRAEWTINL